MTIHLTLSPHTSSSRVWKTKVEFTKMSFGPGCTGSWEGLRQKNKQEGFFHLAKLNAEIYQKVKWHFRYFASKTHSKCEYPIISPFSNIHHTTLKLFHIIQILKIPKKEKGFENFGNVKMIIIFVVISFYLCWFTFWNKFTSNHSKALTFKKC